jgi:hypothetical protein
VDLGSFVIPCLVISMFWSARNKPRDKVITVTVSWSDNQVLTLPPNRSVSRSAVISGTLRCRVIVTEIVAQTRVVAVKAPGLSRGFVGSNDLDPSPLPRGRGEQYRWLRC